MTKESIDNAAVSLSTANKARIRIELPVSPVGMEYVCHKKPDKMLLFIEQLISLAKEKVEDVEFCAIDATRAEGDFLRTAIDVAVNSGATAVSLYDSAAETMLPDEFADFAANVCENSDIDVGVYCNNKNGMAIACASMAVKKGVVAVKTAVGTNAVPLELFAEMIKNCGESFGFSSSIKYTQLNRIVKQINWINENTKNGKNNVLAVENNDNNVDMDASFDKESVMTAVLKLGYDLSEEDSAKVYEEFLRVADKKRVGSKELEAIVASVALQVPATYKLINYIVNNGNIISSSAQITLEKDGEQIQGIAIGDGPVDAAFRAIEQIIGTHFELDDFQIQSVTEGKEAMGSALVKLRANGKLYSGNGISTDIIGASMRAFLSAVNKIVYEEA
jgi:2-isopropylmalate synthase